MPALLSAACGAPVYFAESIQAQVVDAETSAPIAGAHVVANWQLVTGSLDGPHPSGQLMVKETVTDDSGRFSFPSFAAFNVTLDELRDQDPKIVVFKPGYQYARIVNEYPEAGTKTPGMRRRSIIDGQTIRLVRERAPTAGNVWNHYFGLDIELQQILKDCEWDEIPGILAAMGKEHSRLRKTDATSIDSLITAGNVNSYTRSWCQAPASMFEGIDS